MIFPFDYLATEKNKSGSIVIGLKMKIENPGYTTMQKKMQLFCSTCINATRMNLVLSKNADKAFISNGFINWQDARTKNRGFDKHFRSEIQREAHERLFTITDACGNISTPLSTTFNEARSVNRQNLLKILANAKFLAIQALPLRGHGSGEDSNFTQLYSCGKKTTKELRHGRQKKKSINMYTAQFKMR